jgi:hypothetical protein
MGLSASQIEWHNLDHPGLEALGRVDSKKFRAAVIIRPGDQILYEIKPGKWSRVDELDVAIAAGHGVNESVARCRRCLRRVMERRPSTLGFWRSRVEAVALRVLKRAG